MLYKRSEIEMGASFCKEVETGEGSLNSPIRPYRTMKATSQEVLPSMSLVMTCYNQHSFIEEALTSALEMEYSGDKELIIVDDASTDDSLQIMENILKTCPHDVPVRVIRLESNRGVAGAVDAGIAEAQYEWIVLLDGDDVQCPDRLINTAKLIADHPEVGLIAMSALRIDECGRLFGVLPYHIGGYYTGGTPPELYLETSQERLKNMFLSKDHATVSAYGCSMSVRRDILQKWGNLVSDHYEGTRFAQDPVLQDWCTLSAPNFRQQVGGLPLQKPFGEYSQSFT